MCLIPALRLYPKGTFKLTDASEQFNLTVLCHVLEINFRASALSRSLSGRISAAEELE